MIAILATVFVAGIAGSLHCIGMCGPFALICSSRKGEGRVAALSAAAAFNAGRLLIYTLAGAISGTVGVAINVGGSLAGCQRVAAWFAGGSLVIIGSVRLLGWHQRLVRQRTWSHLTRVLHQMLTRIRNLPPMSRAGMVGGANGFDALRLAVRVCICRRGYR